MQSYLQIIKKKVCIKRGIENLRPFRCKDNETLLFQNDGEKDSKEQYWSSKSQRMKNLLLFLSEIYFIIFFLVSLDFFVSSLVYFHQFADYMNC